MAGIYQIYTRMFTSSQVNNIIFWRMLQRLVFRYRFLIQAEAASSRDIL